MGRASRLQNLVDRLDSPSIPAGLDVADYLLVRPSSSRREENQGVFRDLIGAAQLTVLLFKLAEALAIIGSQRRDPVSISACRTHLRNVSAIMPNIEATPTIVANSHSETIVVPVLEHRENGADGSAANAAENSIRRSLRPRRVSRFASDKASRLAIHESREAVSLRCASHDQATSRRPPKPTSGHETSRFLALFQREPA